ncbi:MAG: hypothetical protein M3Y41_05250, partial [Pseudomonadota bacterium]|nr:hypothetical protein [Pseudomonadota bacterium]
MRKRPASALPATPVDVGRPRTIVAAVVALAVAGVAAVIAGLSLYGERGWLADSITKADRTAKPPVHRSASQLASHVSSVQSSQVVASVVLCVALALVAVAVYRGRHWSRWIVLGLWVVCSYTGTLAGLASVLSVSQSIPGPFKSAAFVSGAAFIVAVVAVNLRPSSQYFTAHK